MSQTGCHPHVFDMHTRSLFKSPILELNASGGSDIQDKQIFYTYNACKPNYKMAAHVTVAPSFGRAWSCPP